MEGRRGGRGGERRGEERSWNVGVERETGMDAELEIEMLRTAALGRLLTKMSGLGFQIWTDT